MASSKKIMIDRKYHLFDASGKRLGRLATEIVRILMGKHKVSYAPHIDGGDFVAIINADSVTITSKPEDKIYHRFSGYPSGISSVTFKDQMKKDSRKVLWQAIYNMLPKNSLRNRMLKRLFIYKDADHKQKIIHITH